MKYPEQGNPCSGRLVRPTRARQIKGAASAGSAFELYRKKIMPRMMIPAQIKIIPPQVPGFLILNGVI